MPKPKTSLGSSLKKTNKPKRSDPVWRGPEVDGITFSLLTRFLSCRERFRLLVVEGLKPQDQFNHRLEFGSMWHVCEEALAGCKDKTGGLNVLLGENFGVLSAYAKSLCRKYPHSQEQIDHWYRTVKALFPEYVRYWSEHPDVQARTPLLQEQTFDIPYRLPSGRTVRLRGKWDSVDLVNGGVWLQENKTKGDIREDQIQRQLTFDLQTMLYLVALTEEYERLGGCVRLPADSQWTDLNGTIVSQLPKIRGVRYNVIRRPFSGGKGSIVRHKPSKSNPRGEGLEEYYQRLIDDYVRPEPGYWFTRWNVEITPADVQRFRRECLDPILEQLCDWWQFVSTIDNPFQPVKTDEHGQPYGPALHYRHPFGSINWLDEGGASDLDEYLATGSEAGLQRIDDLFPEL